MLGQQHRGAGVRGSAFFMVMTETLLLGLEQLGETEHLLTAQQVFTVLEAPLLEVIKFDDAQVSLGPNKHRNKIIILATAGLDLTVRSDSNATSV